MAPYTFPLVTKGVSILGKWSFAENIAALDTLGAAITTTTATTLTADRNIVERWTDGTHRIGTDASERCHEHYLVTRGEWHDRGDGA